MTLDNMKLQGNHDGTYRCFGYVDTYRRTIPDDVADSFERLAEAMIAAVESEKRIEKLREDVFYDGLALFLEHHPELDIVDIWRRGKKELKIE